MLKKLLYLYNDGYNPFPHMGRGGLGYHLPGVPKVIHGEGGEGGGYESETDKRLEHISEMIKLLISEINTHETPEVKHGDIKDEILMQKAEDVIEGIDERLNEKENNAYTEKANELTMDVLSESIYEELKDEGLPLMKIDEIDKMNEECKLINEQPQDKREQWLKDKYDNYDFRFFISSKGIIEYNYIEADGAHESLKDPIIDWFIDGDAYKETSIPYQARILGEFVEEIMFSNKYPNISNVLGDLSTSYTFNNHDLLTKSNYLTKTFKQYASTNFDIENPNHFYNLKYAPIDVLKLNSCIESKTRNHNFFDFYGDIQSTTDTVILGKTKFNGFQSEIKKSGVTYVINYKILFNKDTNLLEYFASKPILKDELQKEIKKKGDKYEKNNVDHFYFEWFKITHNKISDYNTMFFYNDGVYVYDMINGSDHIPSSFNYKNGNYSELVPKNSSFYIPSKEYKIRKIIHNKDNKTFRLHDYFTRVDDAKVNVFFKESVRYLNETKQSKKYIGKTINI
jgi:hypothetical protein